MPSVLLMTFSKLEGKSQRPNRLRPISSMNQDLRSPFRLRGSFSEMTGNQVSFDAEV